jgi:hypothetical protein
MMTNENLKLDKIATYLLIFASALIALYAIHSKYPGYILIPLLEAFLLLAAVFIYGFFFMSLFKSNQEKIEAPTALGVGLIFTTFFFYTVCFLKILVPGVIIAFFLAPLPLLVFLLRKGAALPALPVVKNFFNRAPLEYPALFLPFIYAILPPTFYDSLVYHLGIPNLYLQSSGFIATPQFLFANTSVYYEIALIPAVFAGDIVPRIFHFLLGAVFVLAVADFAAEFFGIKKRGIFILALLSMPMTLFLLSTEMNDLIGAFFIFLGIRYLLQKRFPLSALFWGFAVGIKYFNILHMILFLGIYLVKERQFPVKKLTLFGLISAAVVIPMLVKNYVFAGNPFFPFLSQYFPKGFWDSSRLQFVQNDVGKMYYSVLELVKLPYTVSFGSMGFGGAVGAQFLIFLPFLLISEVRQRLGKKWFLLLFSILLLCVGGYLTGSARFIYIVFVFMTFYLAVIYESIDQKIVKFLFIFVIAMNFVTGIALQEQSNHSYQLLSGRYDVEMYKTSMFPSYPAIAYVNEHVIPGTRTIIEGEARNYYLKTPYSVASGIDYSILTQYLDHAENTETILQRLTNDNIGYIIFNLKEFNRLQKEYRRLNEQDWKRLAVLLKDLQSKIVFQQDGVFVFKITPGAAK